MWTARQARNKTTEVVREEKKEKRSIDVKVADRNVDKEEDEKSRKWNERSPTQQQVKHYVFLFKFIYFL